MTQGLTGQPGAHLGAATGGRETDPITAHFEVLLVNTDELRDKAHRIRYEVYCLEKGFEDPREHQGGLERDQYDDHAVQSLLIHRRTGIAAGLARLILPIYEGCERALPFRESCPISPHHGLPPTTTAEASRLLISREFARAHRDHWRNFQPADRPQGDRGAVFQSLLFGLVASIVQMGGPHGVTHICALMRPALHRLLSRLGIYFEPCGPMVEHHGQRQPCFVDLSDVSRAVAEKRPDLWEIMFIEGRLWDSAFEAKVA